MVCNDTLTSKLLSLLEHARRRVQGDKNPGDRRFGISDLKAAVVP